MITIKAVGDLMPGGILTGRSTPFVTKRVMCFFEDADIRVGTLECGIGNNPTFCKNKLQHSSAFVYAKDEDLKRIKNLGINAVSLANNHFFDLGEKGALHTIDLLDNLEIDYFGAGKTLFEAQAPLVYCIKGESVAFLGFCDPRLKHMQFATSNSPGVNPMERNHVIDSIKRAKADYDYVVVVVHWGKEHTWWPAPHVVRMAKIMQKAGASLILGDHPHRIQPLLHNKNCPIAFSLGNFLFPDRIINTPYVTYYPDIKVDKSLLPKVYGFERVYEPSLKLWPDLSNIGMILEARCDKNEVHANHQLTQISRDGVIDFYNETSKIHYKLSRISFWVRCPLYSSIVSIKEFLKRAKKRILFHFGWKLKKR